jgi:hypothetical protein
MRKAVLAWRVDEGTHERIKLAGLAIVAVVSGNRTFGVGDKVNTETVFVIDDRVDDSQQAALVERTARRRLVQHCGRGP